MKALIVIEIPEDHFLITANDLYERLKGYKCELKPMPNKKRMPITKTFSRPQVIGYVDGWNDCIKEIER